MKLGIIIYSNDAETVWNALRFANFSLKNNDEVKVFLLAKGVEYESLSSEKYNMLELAQSLTDEGGKIFACGTCLTARQKEGSNICPISTMQDMYDIVQESDKVLTF